MTVLKGGFRSQRSCKTSLIGPGCAQHHQQPGWGCESWAQTERFDHNGFRKLPCHHIVLSIVDTRHTVIP